MAEAAGGAGPDTGGRVSAGTGVGAGGPAGEGFVRVAAVADIPEGGAVQAVIDGTGVAVFKSGGACHALHNRCAHMNWPLHTGELIDGLVICQGHGWDFDLCTGASRTYPATRVPVYRCKIADGAVWVSVADPPDPSARDRGLVG